MQTRKQSKSAHALFWLLLREVPGYEDRYREVIKEGIVHEHSGGKTTSLSEMYAKYPAEYSRMIEELKGDSRKKRERYDAGRDRSAKRVIAAICTWVDRMGYTFPSPADKIRYVKAIACRAANCPDFNRIPESRLSAVYNLYCERNRTDIAGNPELDYVITKN